jgi:hypothetical protein
VDQLKPLLEDMAVSALDMALLAFGLHSITWRCGENNSAERKAFRLFLKQS